MCHEIRANDSYSEVCYNKRPWKIMPKTKIQVMLKKTVSLYDAVIGCVEVVISGDRWPYSKRSGQKDKSDPESIRNLCFDT